MSTAQAKAHSNIALIKYWGKADVTSNVPAVGSLSMTLDALWTKTRVTFEEGLAEDEVILDGQKAQAKPRERVLRLLDRVREGAKETRRALVESVNNFPTAAGLASSASGFAALTSAACKAAGMNLELAEQSDLARRGSGSAPRSLLGGFVELRPLSELEPGRCEIEQVADASHWDLCMVIALCASGPKAVGSTEGMERSRRTSAYYQAWIDSHADDLRLARQALLARDLDALGEVLEASCFKMHALAMAARPALIYFKPATLAVIELVRSQRREGLVGYVTVDAGPHVKVLCRSKDAEEMEKRVASVPGVRKTLVSGVGPAVEVIA